MFLKYTFSLPHCHLDAQFFPKDFKGKIIHVTRDIRAVAASAFPFMSAISSWKPYLEAWDFKNTDDFAKHWALNQCCWGNITDYDNAWKEYAKKENLDILFLKFEDVVT